MAVDPKIVGGGAAVVAIGGGSGYAISQAVDSSNNNSQTPQSNNSGSRTNNEGNPATNSKEQNKTTNKTSLTSAGFQIESAQESETNCKAKLENSILSTEEDFKGAVKECVKNKKFSDKASALGLDVLTTTNKDTWDTSSWWNTNKTSVSAIISSTSSASDWNNAKTAVTNFCTQTGTESEKGNKTIDGTSSEENWKKFLKACTKDKESVTVAAIEKNNFWTNKAPSAA